MRNRSEEITLRRSKNSKKWVGAVISLASLPIKLLIGLKGILFAVMVSVGVYFAAINFGLPAIHYAYDYQNRVGQQPYKTTCRYISPYGIHERSAVNGYCAWIVLAKGAWS